MDTFLLASGMIAAIFFLAVSLVSMGTEDRELIAEISDMLGMARRFNFSKGWVAESKAPRSRIWVSRWEDVTYEMADLMIFVALARPLPFPFVLANVKRAATGFPFDTQFSQTKDMEELDVPEVTNALFTYCRKNDRDRCVDVIRQIGDILPRFGRIADERRALFQIGQRNIQISLDLGAGLSDVKALYDAALGVAETINTVELY